MHVEDWHASVTAAGFHTEGGGGGGLEFSLPRNLEIEYISYLHITEHIYVSSKCSEILSQIASEAI